MKFGPRDITARTVRRALMASRCVYLFAAALALGALVSAAAAAEQLNLRVEVRDNALQVVDRGALPVPRHHAGAYVRWTNEREFIERLQLKERMTYQVTANINRVEVAQFPQGWGRRSGQHYSTYHLQALSARESTEK